MCSTYIVSFKLSEVTEITHIDLTEKKNKLQQENAAIRKLRSVSQL